MKWAPLWAPWASGDFVISRSIADAEPIKIDLSCAECGDKSKTVCTQGTPRTQISRYALLHMHGKDKDKWLK